MKLFTAEQLAPLTKKELVALAGANDLEIDSNFNKGEYLEEMLTVESSLDEDDIPEDDMTEKDIANAEALAKRDSEFVQPAAFDDDRVSVIFSEGSGPEGKQPIKVSVNGKPWQIKRNKVVSLPCAVLRVIDDAVITEFDQELENGVLTSVPRDVPRFHYRPASD